jgi:hypothetical protein
MCFGIAFLLFLADLPNLSFSSKMIRTAAPAADGTVISSLEGTQWVRDKTSPPRELPSKKFHEVSTTFKLPITASELYFVSRGSRSSGAITVVPLAGEHSAEVVVHVSATYDDASALKDVYVCALERNGGRGIGIYVRVLIRTSDVLR